MNDFIKGLRDAQYQELPCSLSRPRMQIEPWCEVVQYTGKPKQLAFELCVKDGWFYRKPILASDNELNLKIMAYYVMHNPVCKSWRLSIRRSNLWARSGNFMIVERCGWKGDSELLISLATRIGATHEEVDWIVKNSTEDVLAYVVSSDLEDAKKLATIAETGAKAKPASVEDLEKIVDLKIKRAEYRERA